MEATPSLKCWICVAKLTTLRLNHRMMEIRLQKHDSLCVHITENAHSALFFFLQLTTFQIPIPPPHASETSSSFHIWKGPLLLQVLHVLKKPMKDLLDDYDVKSRTVSP